MPIEPIKEFNIENEGDADLRLSALFKIPENRSMNAIMEHAEDIEDPRIRTYFITKAREMLGAYDRQ
jgi:hypothetical protein